MAAYKTIRFTSMSELNKYLNDNGILTSEIVYIGVDPGNNSQIILLYYK